MTAPSQPSAPRVLVVDDDPVVRRIVARGLAALPVGEVIEVADGIQAPAILRERSIDVVVVSGVGSDGVDVETVAQETSAAFTASHLGALMRVAQIATALGADLGDLVAVPAAVEAALDGPGPQVEVPARLLEYTGAGPNQWTAAEGALKLREAALFDLVP